VTVVSLHKDRVVREEGDLFVKEFASKKDRDAEVERLDWLKKAGVAVPEIVELSGTTFVTARLPGRPLDELIAEGWTSLHRSLKNALIKRVAALCRRVRDGGFDWPDLVTYHIFVSDDQLAVIDPARLRKGRLGLSALYWSCDEPTVTRSDRLRFWRAYAGAALPPRLRAIGHRGRFRPYRWVFQRQAPRACPPFSDFVNTVDLPYSSADEIIEHPSFNVRRELKDRINGEIGDLVVKITTDPAEARSEWINHAKMLAAGFRVPQPAAGGLLSDGRGLFATVRLHDRYPMDDIWSTLDRKKAVRAVADLARRLHACSLCHKDLYLNHLFVARGGDEITIIDLARMIRTRARRWRVKDLAALLMSAQGLWSRTDAMRALKRYGGDRKLARAVIRKAAKMARHVPRNVRDGTHTPHVPCTSE
jgi:tRNA A-37 threonylcarbamoyl transferase component Bud32